MAAATFTVGSFNMLGADLGTPPPNDWATRRPAFAAHVLGSGASIMAWQETAYSNTPAQSQALQAIATINSQAGQPNKWTCALSTEIGNVIAWDTTVMEIVSNPVTEPININNTVGQARAMVWARFRHKPSDRVFTFVATHWQDNTPNAANGELRRVESASIISARLNEIGGQTTYPAIIGADFNTGVLTSGARDLLAGGGYRSLTVPAASTSVNGAYNSYNGLNPNMTGNVSGVWIDGVHGAAPFAVVAAGVYLDFANGSTLPLKTPLPSDHNLVWATVTLAEEPPPQMPKEADIRPRRNLGLAEHWGRKVETRQNEILDEILAQGGSLDGLVRYSASSAGDIARQIQGISTAHAALPIPISATGTAANFSLPTAWTTRGSVQLVVPAGKTNVDIFALGRVAVPAAESGASATRFQWPFPTSTVTSEYGMRVNPVDGVYRMHWGIDFSYSGISGDAIKAPGDGIVIGKGYDDGRGNWLELSHAGPGITLRTRYFHMQSASSLSIGASVIRNVTTLGLVGTTGNSTGPHLHWETEADGDTINPRDFMDDYGQIAAPAGPPPIRGRVLIAGNASFEVFSGDIGGFQIVHGRTFAVTPGATITIENQIRSTVARPAATDRMASLTVLGAFRP